MDTGTLVFGTVTFATLLIEGIKWVAGKIKPGLELPMKFYYFLLPVLTFAVEPLMSVLGFMEYALPMSWQGWTLELLRVALMSLASVALYENSIKKLKEAKARKESLG